MAVTSLEPAAKAVSHDWPRVLLVDDSITARDSLAALLTSSFPVRVAGEAIDGPEGLAMAVALQPDLVITDLQMPGFDGLQLVKRLRRDHPAIRSIVVSANEGNVWHKLSQSHGADGFISKRRIPKELPSLLERLFPALADDLKENENL